MLRYRLISAVVMLSVVGLDVWLELHFRAAVVDEPTALAALLANGLLTMVLLSLITGAAALEFCGLLQHAGHRPFRALTAIWSVAFVLLPWLADRLDPAVMQLPWTAIVLGLAVVTIFLRQMATQTIDGALPRVGGSLMGVAYIGGLGAFLALLEVDFGILTLAGVIVVTKFCDIGAYTAGRLFGKRKMIPWLSPGKTWAGMVGGIVFSTVVACLLPLVAGWLEAPPPDATGPFEPTFAAVWTVGLGLVLGPFLAVVGQVGDLAESLLKRSVAQKDSAAIIPGFGGLLDVVDSILFAAFAAWAVLTLTALLG